MKKSSFTVIAILIGLVLVGLLIAVPLIFFRQWSDFGWAMGPGMMGGDFGYHMPFGGIGMSFMWLIPLLIVGLLVAGAIASIVSLSRPSNPSPAILPPAPAVYGTATAQPCPNCGRGVEPDWVACPYCAASLKS